MRLIPNWKSVASTAHSMWAFYASLICLLLPEVLFAAFEIDTNPRIWWVLGIALLLYGIIGRLWDQGIDRSKIQSPWIVGVLAITVVAALAIQHGTSLTNTGLNTTQSTGAGEQEIATSSSSSGQSYDAPFLEIAVPFIGRWEGLRLEAYLDMMGVPTVCYGETKGVSLGQSYTKAQCDAMFSREIVSYRDRLRAAFTPQTVADRLPLGRDVAFTSLAYNVGVSGTSKSTAVRRLNQANIAGACEALGWWNKAGGRVVRGLVNRRSEETAMCMTGAA